MHSTMPCIDLLEEKKSNLTKPAVSKKHLEANGSHCALWGPQGQRSLNFGHAVRRLVSHESKVSHASFMPSTPHLLRALQVTKSFRSCTLEYVHLLQCWYGDVSRKIASLRAKQHLTSRTWKVSPVPSAWRTFLLRSSSDLFQCFSFCSAFFSCIHDRTDLICTVHNVSIPI